ncbi:MAG: L-histidine N(alpha)-methyltransferase [Saccharospirillaceae bacterium]|nr:L-histidine N(alpha)-methyltransferase [Saccharospirillaceae bacterium]
MVDPQLAPLSNDIKNDVKIDIKDNQFLKDVLQGLSQTNKTLPCKYFYDEKGSQLFEQICELDEYYVTDTEIKLLQNNMSDIAKFIQPNCNIIEPGSGAGIKIQLLLSALDQPKSFTALEISPSALKYSVATIKKKYPALEVNGLLGDFTDQENINKIKGSQGNNNLVFFPGSTIGNFEVDQAITVLKNLSSLAGDGQILIGVDLIKPLNTMLEAYNDKKGITAAFNKNLLHRINSELNGQIEVEQNFKHQSIFNAEKSRIEMHLISKQDHSIKVNGVDFHFKEGESVHTENSHKYSTTSFERLANLAGLKIKQSWYAPNKAFVLFLLEK